MAGFLLGAPMRALDGGGPGLASPVIERNLTLGRNHS